MTPDAGRTEPRIWRYLTIILAAAGAFLGALLVYRWRRQRIIEKRREARLKLHTPQPQTLLHLRGLTEAEAASRQREGQDNTVLFKPPQSKEEILRSSLFTIFHLSMLGLIAVQLLLGVPQSAFWTSVVLVLSIGLGIARKLQVRAQLMKLEQTTRPQATVIREGAVRSIDASQVVQGDILVAGPGDQILTDGQLLGEGSIVVDETMLTGDPQQHVRQVGDMVYAGSVCVAGHGAYEAQKVGDERLIVSLAGGPPATGVQLTPLEHLLSGVLQIMLVVVAVLSVLLLASYYARPLAFLHADAFSSAASVIFGLAPAGLFFTVLLKYTRGAEIMARIGALVHRARSVESLAEATTICLAHAGILTGTDLTLEPIEGPHQLAESRLRQILGDYARSVAGEHASLRAMEAEFPGELRHAVEEAPFLSLYGWSAMAFDHDDLRGVYVLGDPEMLEPHLITDEEAPGEVLEDEAQPVSWRDRLRLAPQLNKLRQALRRSGEGSEAEPGGEGVVQSCAPSDADTAAQDSGQATDGGGLSQRAASAVGWVQHAVQPITARLGLGTDGKDGHSEEPQDAESEEQEDMDQVEELVYLLAYRPEIVPLHSTDGMARLPGNLAPLCRLRHTLAVRQDAVETMEAFSLTGVGVKVFSADPPSEVSAALEMAGLDLEAREGVSLRAISGAELAELDAQHLGRAVSENSIFGELTPGQRGQLVRAIQEQGQVVAVAGDSVNDLQAMRQAHLSITLRSSSPAALGEADIVLLEDSPRLLLKVVETGQRVVNGLLDILRLYMVKLSNVTLLTLVIWLAGLGFPYQSKQGSIIALLSVTLPSLAFVFWSPLGALPRADFGRLLARFVAPVGMSISIAGLGVYLFFLKYGELGDAQLALTYVLALSGLVVVLLVRPPVRGLPGRMSVAAGLDSSDRYGDKRPALLVLVLVILFFVLAAIPLGDQLFGLTLLPQPTDYLVVGLAILVWVLLVNLFWWATSRWAWWLGKRSPEAVSPSPLPEF